MLRSPQFAASRALMLSNFRSVHSSTGNGQILNRTFCTQPLISASFNMNGTMAGVFHAREILAGHTLACPCWSSSGCFCPFKLTTHACDGAIKSFKSATLTAPDHFSPMLRCQAAEALPVLFSQISQLQSWGLLLEEEARLKHQLSKRCSS